MTWGVRRYGGVLHSAGMGVVLYMSFAVGGCADRGDGVWLRRGERSHEEQLVDDVEGEEHLARVVGVDAGQRQLEHAAHRSRAIRECRERREGDGTWCGRGVGRVGCG